MPTLKLDWQAPKPGEMPFRPVVTIKLTWVAGDGAGQYFLTPNCVSIEEFEANVRELKAQIDQCVKLARRRFARDRAYWAARKAARDQKGDPPDAPLP